MTTTDRTAYQEAVQCLMRTPTRNVGIDGARTAWDDYGVLHYQQTPFVHNSATFLLWHRHYNWILEQDLHDLCGYNGRPFQLLLLPISRGNVLIFDL